MTARTLPASRCSLEPDGPGGARSGAHPIDGGRRVRVDGAGRTDAGVHASGQVIAFTCDGRLRRTELGRALEALPPGGCRDPRSATGTGRFHPRFAARYREYRYTVWNGPRSPLRERYALGVRDPLDTAAMARAAAGLRRPARLLAPSGQRTGSRSGPCTGSGSGGQGRWSRSTSPATPSCATWSGASWPPSWRSARERWTTRRSPRRWRRTAGVRRGGRSGQGADACGGSSWDGRPTRNERRRRRRQQE